MAAVPQAAVRLAVARRRHQGPRRPHVGHFHGKAQIVKEANVSSTEPAKRLVGVVKQELQGQAEEFSKSRINF